MQIWKLENQGRKIFFLTKVIFKALLNSSFQTMFVSNFISFRFLRKGRQGNTLPQYRIVIISE